VSARPAQAVKSPQKVQRELEDLQLVLKARNGSSVAMDQLIRRYTSFVRLKASSYFLAGGDSEDLIQEGLVGLYKAVRDFRPDKETSFRSFAELCVTRQIITAIKTATRFKHAPLNTYVSFSHTPAGQDGDGDVTLGDALPGPSVNDPSVACRRPCRRSRRTRCASTSKARPTSRWPRSWGATRRRSTTPSSA
jgi:RNA polymerase sporulation-specific sigma factor